MAQMTREEFVEKLTTNLNNQLDVPFLNEEQEQEYLSIAVGFLAQYVPESFYGFFVDASDGLSPEEVGRHVDTLVIVLNERIDIPWVPEGTEGVLIRQVVEKAFAFAREGLSL